MSRTKDQTMKDIDGDLKSRSANVHEHEFVIPVEWEYIRQTVRTRKIDSYDMYDYACKEYPPKAKKVTKLRCACGEEIAR